MAEARIFEFDEFRADVARRTLERDGRPVALSGKAFEILTVLLERAGDLVDKDTLMREVWPDTAVEENNLTVNISALRKALGDSAASPRLIVTVSGRGYRFTGELRDHARSEPVAIAAVAQKSVAWRPVVAWALLWSLIGAAIGTAIWIWMQNRCAASPC